MSLLDDARAMGGMGRSLFLDFDTGGEPYVDGDPHATAHFMCVFCSVRQAFVSDEPFVHRHNCPWLSVPKIVAALEAAERLLACEGRNDDREWFALGEALDA